MSIIYSIIGGIISSTLVNYFSDVLPGSRKISAPLCRGCQQQFHLIPYLLIKPCSNCGRKRGIRALVVVFLMVGSSFFLNQHPFFGLGYWASLPILVFFGTIVVIDIEHHLVLLETSLSGMLMLMVYGWYIRGIIPTILGGLAGFLILFTLFILGVGFARLVGRIRRRKVGEVAFGFGDVFAGTFLGLLAGWPGIAGVVILGMLTFAAFSVVYLLMLIATRRYRAFGNPLPFVPFLVLGTVVMHYL